MPLYLDPITRAANRAAWERIFAQVPPHQPRAHDDGVVDEPIDDGETCSAWECEARARDEVWHG